MAWHGMACCSVAVPKRERGRRTGDADQTPDALSRGSPFDLCALVLFPKPTLGLACTGLEDAVSCTTVEGKAR